MKKTSDSIDSFVQAWQASDSVSDALQRAQWQGSRQSFIGTASKLRKKGVPLKKFKDAGLRSAAINAICDDQFIEIWQTSVSVAEVARRLGISYNYVSVKAHRLFKNGVTLKQFRERR